MPEPQDFIAAGYKRFDSVKHVRSYADYGLQKLIQDNKGKRYYITVYVYDNRTLKKQRPELLMADFSFEPDVQFCTDLTINVQFGIQHNTSIEDIEYMFNKLWLTVSKPYYELWY